MKYPQRTRNYLLVPSLLLTAMPALAQDNWINPATAAWTNGASWSTGSAPNGPGNEEGRIDNGGTATLDISQTDSWTGVPGEITTGSLTLGSQPGTTGAATMSSGTFVLKNTDFRIGGSPVVAIGGAVPAIGGTGVFTQTGGAVVQQGGNLNIGIRGAAAAETSPAVAEGTYNLSGADSSYEVRFGFIVVIGNRAKGTLNQSGGHLVVKGLGTQGNPAGVLGSIIQLGRNAIANTSFTSGTYNLSGGSATAAFFRMGQANVNSSTNTFNLSGTGRLQTGSMEFLTAAGTSAVNIFNFTGGTLSANTVGIPVTNNGGTLSPYLIDFSTVTTTTGATINPVGTMTFTGANGYTQAANGNLAIDIGPGTNDFVDIGAGAEVAAASLAGRITVNPVGGFDPPVGSAFYVLSADTVTSTAAVIGHTASCNFFRPDIVPGGDGRQMLRLTVVAAPATYAEWQAIYQAGAFAADDDSDGLSNGLEYRLGTLPNDATGANGRAPVSSFAGSGATQHLRLEFPVAEPAGNDATLQVQVSSDLGVNDPWTTIASKIGQAAWTGPATVTLGAASNCQVPVTVDDTAFTDTTLRRFYRLRAVTP